VCRSLRRTLSAHGTKRPALLRSQNLPCACDGVSPESCVSLGANAVPGLSWDMYVERSEAELGKRHSPPRLYTHDVDSRSQSKISQQPILKPLSHIYSNHSNHNQCSFLRASYTPLVTFRAHTSNPFTAFRTHPFRPWSRCVIFPPYLP